MTKAEFLVLMQFPEAWASLNMYPDELAHEQIERYRLGHEEGSEHDRNGAFHWWLRRSPNQEQIANLKKLSYLDPDRKLGADMRQHLNNYQNIITKLKHKKTQYE